MARKSKAHNLEAIAREVFEITKITWAAGRQGRQDVTCDLSQTEFLALDALQQQDCLTVGELQRRIRVRPARMSRIIKHLETGYHRPLVRCTINREDKRKVDVHITQAGDKAADTFRRSSIETTLTAMESLSERDLNDLVRIVRIVRKEMET